MGCLSLLFREPYSGNSMRPKLINALLTRVIAVLAFVFGGVVQAQQIVVGVYDNPPKIFLNEAGLPAGILIDLLDEMARIEQWHVQYRPCHWQECVDLLKAEEIDLMPDMAYTQLRDQEFDFHAIPVLYSWSMVYVRPGTSITYVTDLSEKRVAILKGSVQVEAFKTLQHNYGFRARLEEVDSLTEVFQRLAVGSVDAGIANNFFGLYNMADYDVVETPVIFGAIQLFFATKQGRHADLLAAIDRHMGRWRTDPESIYFKTLKGWQSESELHAIAAHFWRILGATVALLLATLVIAVLLRWRVRARTQELSRSLASLHETETRFRALFEQANDAILILDDLQVIDCNRRAEEMFGVTRQQILAANPLLDLRGAEPGGLAARLYLSRQIAIALSGSTAVFEARKSAPDGTTIDIEIYLNRVALKSAAYIQAIVRDVTALKRYQEQLERIAHYDPLTGLPNRLLRADRLNQAIARAARTGAHVAVVFLDLDGFKDINDHYGHEVGDGLLIEVAKHLQEALRTEDTLARVGGDEFVALIVDLMRPEECISVLDRLLHAAAVPVQVHWRRSSGESLSELTLAVSASVGVAFYPQDGGEPDTLMRRADQAMYQAKQAGRNRYVFFDSRQDQAIQSRHEALARLTAALEADEFVLFYQPKINMARLTVVGVEALIRWAHPQKGLLPPAAFLPVLDNHPLSIEVGEWVIRQALAQMRDWQAQGLDLAVSVNISAIHLQQDDFAERLGGILMAFPAVCPDKLQLEVLETSALSDMSKIIVTMQDCRELGVSFALDDFGTGYSSLSYLRRLPVQTLKIDQSFVRDMLEDGGDQAIVKDIIGLASAFNCEVIAEGVETQAHGDRLLALGCEEAQGYGIARPMDPADIPQWVQQWNQQAKWLA